MKRTELLAPAGNMEALKAAVLNGADAVYFGGPIHNARQSADNFDNETMKEAIEYCHIRGVKAYITLNTLLEDQELDEVIEYIIYLDRVGADAVIIQDVALIEIIGKHAPGLEIHGSTQMSIHNLAGVKKIEELGAQRVVLSREMAIEEVKYIKDNTGIALEIFVHGALCVSYSGQCLMSSMIGGRSGNKGSCAQPCRRKYELVDMENVREKIETNGQYLLSTKDLCTLESIGAIIESGVDSLKIEGRMKRAEYVAIVVKAYREAIDAYYEKKQWDFDQAYKEVQQIYNRKFTKGYLLEDRSDDVINTEKPNNWGIKLGWMEAVSGHKIRLHIVEPLRKGDIIEIIESNGKTTVITISDMYQKGVPVEEGKPGDKIELRALQNITGKRLVYKVSDKGLVQKAKESYQREKGLVGIKMSFEGFLGKVVKINVADRDGNKVEVTGSDLIEKGLNKVIDQATIEKQLSKLGSTAYYLKKLSIDISDGVMIPAGQINQLRRSAVEQLDDLRKHRTTKNKKEILGAKDGGSERERFERLEKIELAVQVRTIEQLEIAFKEPVDRIYFDNIYDLKQALDLGVEAQQEIIPVVPNITSDQALEDILAVVKNNGVERVMVSNIGSIDLFKAEGIDVIGNYTLNITNKKALKAYGDMGLSEATVSTELDYFSIKSLVKNSMIPCELVVDGKLTLMTTENCPIAFHYEKGENCGTCHNKRFGLKDGMGKSFELAREYGCKMRVLNSDRLCLLNNLDKIKTMNINSIRIILNAEKGININNRIYAYKQKLRKSDFYNERVEGVWTENKREGFTRGYFLKNK